LPRNNFNHQKSNLEKLDCDWFCLHFSTNKIK